MSFLGSMISAPMNAMNVANTNATNLKIAKAQTKANVKLAQMANQWNIDQWNRENEYNSPVNQVQRMKEAGMSDAAAVQSATNMPASSIQSADLAQAQGATMQAPQFDFSGLDVLGAMRQYEQLRKDKEDADQSALKTKRDEMDTSWYPTFLMTKYDAQRADIDLKKQTLLHTWQSFPYTLRALRFQADAMGRLPALKDLEIKNAQANWEQVKFNVKLARQQFDWLDKIHEKEFDKMCEEIKNVVKQGRVLDTQASLNKSQEQVNIAQKENIEEDTRNKELQGKGMKFENKIKEINAIFAKHGCPESTAQKIGILYAEGKLNVDNLDKALSGMKTYVEKGYDTLGVSPFTRDLLYYVVDEGSSQASKLGFYTLGGLRESLNLFPWFNSQTPQR